MLAYLDHHATTPCDPAVVAAMAPWWSEAFANPASRLYRPALQAAAAVEQARGRIGRALGVAPETVCFTSGATEANNLALKGVVEAASERGLSRRRIVSLVSEHRAVRDPLAHLQRHGVPLTLLPVQPDGLLDLNRLEEALTPDVLLLSVMAANNEIGVLQPLAAIGRLCRDRGVLFHCDAAQAVGQIPLAAEELGIDLLSLSGHKLYGPKGVGALLVRPGVPLAAQQHGGGQEGGLRAGTLPVPLIVGLGVAVEQALADREARALRLGPLRDRLQQALENLGGVTLNGCATARLPHSLNVSVAGLDGTRLHQRLRRQIAVSSGSACSQGSPSHVLAALGRSRAEAAASIRFGLGRGTTEADISTAITAVREAVNQLRSGPTGW
ncbi:MULTISPECIES: cysteine desulfurase family protein [unclassified Synechococcus]|uniref:cysteine desulfurase family protein n=2 Tax=Synechococcus TaxID=1129 RepID=UPI002AD45A7B|nr:MULTISPECIES: cysteine desulfurase family protein [unclassified Synechococcus]MEA5421866.1 cysteine desulfurase family protein [Synechococcus sp. CCY9202]CAK6689270.1 Cysteine desulfurase IscS [Synechococcus sp. CBW1107]